MMFFSKEKIEAAADHVSNYSEFEVIYNEKDILVIADNSQSINEFEAQLAARNIEWDEEIVDGRALMETLVDIQGNRTEFRPRHTNDEWQARYTITTTL